MRADGFFLGLWVRYYGAMFGRENLHVMLDGDDWTPDCDVVGVHLDVVKDVPQFRPKRMRFTAVWQSKFANRLLERGGVDTVLRTDIDEFVAVDPQAGPHPGFITDGNVARGYHVHLPDRMGALLPTSVAVQ